MMQSVFWRLFRWIPGLLLLIVVGSVAAEAAPEKVRYQRSVEKYVVPDVVLVNQNGDKVRLRALLDDQRPVVVDFIYGTCTTICPILSAGYANLQKRLGEQSSQVRLVSVTIDPENDDPAVLREYLARYKAKPGWDFLTGSRQDINRVMEAFDAFFRDKMDHKPLTFIRLPKDGRWVRLYGLVSGKDFLNEFEKAGLQ